MCWISPLAQHYIESINSHRMMAYTVNTCGCMTEFDNVLLQWWLNVVFCSDLFLLIYTSIPPKGCLIVYVALGKIPIAVDKKHLIKTLFLKTHSYIKYQVGKKNNSCVVEMFILNNMLLLIFHFFFYSERPEKALFNTLTTGNWLLHQQPTKSELMLGSGFRSCSWLTV